MNRAMRLLIWIAAQLAADAGVAAEQVWDPSETARLAEQAAQLALANSQIVALEQQISQIATLIGPSGVASVAAQRAQQSRPGATAIASILTSASIAPTDMPGPGASTLQRLAAAKNYGLASVAAARDGFTLSQQLMSLTPTLASESQALADQAVAAGSTREKVQSDSAVCLSLLDRLTSIAAILIFELEAESAEKLAARIVAGGGT